MIQLTRLNGQPLVVNSDLIKLIEYAPDTLITLMNGEKIIVRESGEQILERIVQFRRRVLDGLPLNFSNLGTCKEAPAEDAPKQPPSEEE